MMSEKYADAHQNAIDRFWRNYLSSLEKHSIPKRSQSWYLKHAQKYINTHKDQQFSIRITTTRYYTARQTVTIPV